MTREQKLEQALRLVTQSAYFPHMTAETRDKINTALSTPKVEAAELVEPVAYLVHNFMVARQPVKAQGRFPSPDHYLYPASRKDDAEATAKTLRADCDPLYISPTPVPTITDEAVERAAKAIHDGPLGADEEADFGDNESSDWCREVACTALTAAFPSSGEAE